METHKIMYCFGCIVFRGNIALQVGSMHKNDEQNTYGRYRDHSRSKHSESGNMKSRYASDDFSL